jgi:hypothetical protein
MHVDVRAKWSYIYASVDSVGPVYEAVGDPAPSVKQLILQADDLEPAPMAVEAKQADSGADTGT